MNVSRLANNEISETSSNYSDGNSRLNSRNLPLGFSALLQFRHLLALYRGSNNLLSKNDVADFTGCQRRNVDAVTLAEVLRSKRVRHHGNLTMSNVTHSQNEVLHGNFDLDPFVIR